MRFLLVALLLCFGTAAMANGEVEEAEAPAAVEEERSAGMWLHPFAGLTIDRPSGPDDWSTGWIFGVEVEAGQMALIATYQLHDVLSDSELYDWDSTFELEACFKTAYRFLGISTAPHGGLTLSRPSHPADWSVGMRLGAEADLGGLFLDASYQLLDAWTETDVYPFDGTLRLVAGTYF